jgi:tetratricopeptide (TPR) repeat protein
VEAVAACRAALKEQTRERVPLHWAATQYNLGNALWRLGERERGTGKLEEAVAAYREALKEHTRERARVGDDAEQSRCCALYAWGAGERDGASGGGGCGLSHRAGGTDLRARSAPLGGNAEQSR